MNRAVVDRIANAVLYEGYLLYPYRPSVKNRQRWTFGGLYPEAYCHRGSGETSENQTECLIRGTPAIVVEAIVRFLHLTQRSEKGVPDTFFEWQEAEEREVSLGDATLGDLSTQPQRVSFSFPGSHRMEPLHGPDGESAGTVIRQQQSITGDIEAAAAELAEGLFRLTLRVVNRTPLDDPASVSRDAALLHSLVSAHTILGVRGGDFVSLLDPPDRWREAAASCRNVGVWPVLVGAEGQTDTVLASPIILYDYPQVAPESPGDFFDGTEIDEMLTLRILTLTDDEKRAMAAVDERARSLLARTEALAREQMLGLHGTIRTPGEKTHG
jgi:hypothetical protein